MKTNLYVIYDRVAEESGPIFEAKNDLVADRNFKKLLSEHKTELSNDFKLLRIGTFDHETNGVQGELIPVEVEFLILNEEE
jgi:hypothetical protein